MAQTPEQQTCGPLNGGGCGLSWSGPWTDCPGCTASAAAKALSDALVQNRILSEQNTILRGALEAERVRALNAFGGLKFQVIAENLADALARVQAVK